MHDQLPFTIYFGIPFRRSSIPVRFLISVIVLPESVDINDCKHPVTGFRNDDLDCLPSVVNKRMSVK